jgi:Na+/melibiose symporter-like transporter
MTGSLGTWIALTSLAWVGFDASPNGYNNPDQLFGLRLLFSTIPSVFYFIAMAIIWNYPITKAKHTEMRQELETRNLSRSN